MNSCNKNNITVIKETIYEAQRFIRKARFWLDRIEKKDTWSSKEGGACKRASMDLTRSLVRLRR